MISISEVMTFSNTERSFFEDNLLDADDWENGHSFEVASRTDSSPTSSLSSGEFSFLEQKSSPMQDDNIDTWLFNELDILLPQEQEKQIENTLHDNIIIKQEPLSPVSNSYPAVQTCISPNIPAAPKIPISRNYTQHTTTNIPSTTNIKQQILQSSTALAAPKTVITENLVKGKNIVPVVKAVSNQKTIAPIKVATPAIVPQTQATRPQVVQLRNGQYVVANTMIKPVHNQTASTNKAGIKRTSGVKIEDLLPPPKTVDELKNYKRQQRMIKNRESACISRQKKRERLQNLEERVSKITTINQQLKEENDLLKERIRKLETENLYLKESPLISKENAKKSTVLLAMIVFLVFVPFKMFNDTQDISSPINTLPLKPLHHNSRSLLQYDTHQHITYRNSVFDKNNPSKQPNRHMRDFFNTEKYPNENIPHIRRSKFKKKDYLERDFKKYESNFQNPDTDIDCGEHFNKTELNRITEALEGLAKGFAKKKLKKKGKSLTLLSQEESSGNSTLKVKKRVQHENCNDSHTSKPPPTSSWKTNKHKNLRKVVQAKTNQIQAAKNQSLELFQAIEKSLRSKRKADTFYVVSLIKDTFILPATSYNDTQRPKVTFMLPAYLPNPNNNSSSSNNLDEVPMLQIDCHVIDTTLVHIQKNSLSKNYLLT